MVLSTATVSSSTTIALICILTAATWTAYNEGKRRGRREESVVDKEVNDGLVADDEGEDKDDDDVLPVYPIGKLQSIYRLCVGTPRQGESLQPLVFVLQCINCYAYDVYFFITHPSLLYVDIGMLAPHSRGIITFDETRISKDSILDLQNYR